MNKDSQKIYENYLGGGIVTIEEEPQAQAQDPAAPAAPGHAQSDIPAPATAPGAVDPSAQLAEWIGQEPEAAITALMKVPGVSQLLQQRGAQPAPAAPGPPQPPAASHQPAGSAPGSGVGHDGKPTAVRPVDTHGQQT